MNMTMGDNGYLVWMTMTMNIADLVWRKKHKQTITGPRWQCALLLSFKWLHANQLIITTMRGRMIDRLMIMAAKVPSSSASNGSTHINWSWSWSSQLSKCRMCLSKVHLQWLMLLELPQQCPTVMMIIVTMMMMIKSGLMKWKSPELPQQCPVVWVPHHLSPPHIRIGKY